MGCMEPFPMCINGLLAVINGERGFVFFFKNIRA